MRFILLALLLLSSCGAFQKREKKIVEIQDGEPCTIAESDAGAIISCPDGSVVEIPKPAAGAKGAPGDQGPRGPAGSPGPAGESEPCKVTQTETGALIECPDGTTAEVKNGVDGSVGGGCHAVTKPYGADIVCDDGTVIPIHNGRDGSGFRRGRRWSCRGAYRTNNYTWRLHLTVNDFSIGGEEETNTTLYQLTEEIFVGNRLTGTSRHGTWWEGEVIPMVGEDFSALLNPAANTVEWGRLGNNYRWTRNCEAPSKAVIL